MHNVQIELDDILYDRYKELAKKDRRSVRSYITKMVEDNLDTEVIKIPTEVIKESPIPISVAKTTDIKSNTFFDKEVNVWRLRDKAECVLCEGVILPTMDYFGNPVAGWTHRECFEKENGQ
jgi:hypothetical protein